MPTFDIVSEVDMHEVNNAVDQANREVGTRFDFKGANAKFEQADTEITMSAEADFQLKQMLDILNLKLTKRGVDVACMDIKDAEVTGKVAHQKIILKQGIETVLAKKIIKMIKDSKIKVQTSIQGEKLRVNGKKRDDLQSVIGLLKQSDLELPLQYENFRE